MVLQSVHPPLSSADGISKQLSCGNSLDAEKRVPDGEVGETYHCNWHLCNSGWTARGGSHLYRASMLIVVLLISHMN